jgi:hypothetical protein
MWHGGSITGETHYCVAGDERWLKLKSIATQLEDPQLAARKMGRPSSYLLVWGVTAILGAGALLAAWMISHKPVPVAVNSMPLPKLPPKLPPSFEPRLSEFFREASRLSALTDIGVTNQKYREQFITTTAAFEMLVTTWPSDYSSEAKHEFEQAMRGWKLLHEFWLRDMKMQADLKIQMDAQAYYYHSIPLGNNTEVARIQRERELLQAQKAIAAPYASEHDPKFIQILEEYAPERIMYEEAKSKGRVINYNTNIKVLMSVAIEHFQSGRKLIEDNTFKK